jgi:hypothetical protein
MAIVPATACSTSVTDVVVLVAVSEKEEGRAVARQASSRCEPMNPGGSVTMTCMPSTVDTVRTPRREDI